MNALPDLTRARPELTRDRGLANFFKRDIDATTLLNRDNISIITILLTYQCPAACDHCVFESSPKNLATVDMDVARRLVKAAARQDPKPVLGFSGGEPFLKIKAMKELTSLAASLGMPSEVVSSSAWAKTDKFAYDTLQDLADRGLQTYCTSVDRFHTDYIAAEKMRRAILAAHECGLHVIINSQTTKDICLLYTSPSPRDATLSRMPSSA